MKEKDIPYSVEIGPDVKYDLRRFREDVHKYLEDPNGWKSRGYRFYLVDRNPRIAIILTSPATLKKNGCQDENLSCAILNGGKVWINAMRWTEGSKESKQKLHGYRQYVISHEVGHALGYDHVGCPGDHADAPVMMQQTLGIEACKPNTKLTPADNKKV